MNQSAGNIKYQTALINALSPKEGSRANSATQKDKKPYTAYMKDPKAQKRKYLMEQ